MKTAQTTGRRGALALFALAAFFCAWRLWRLRYFHEFSDESDNIVVGWLLTRGYRLYDTVWSQHTPTGYIFSQLAAALLPRDFASFRAVPYVFYLATAASFAGSPLFSRRRTSGIRWAALLLSTIALLAPLWWGQMLLVDTIWGCCLAISVLMLHLPALRRLPINRYQAAIGASATILFLSGSQITVYLVPFVVLSYGFLLGSQKWRVHATALAASLLTLVLYAAWILRFSDFNGLYENAFLLNLKVYSGYASRGEGPLQLFTRVTGENIADFTQVLHGFRGWLSFEYVFRWVALAVAFFLPVSHFGLRRSKPKAWIAMGATLLFLSCTRMREGNFHAAPFFIVSLTLAFAIMAQRRARLIAAVFILLSIRIAAREETFHWANDSFALQQEQSETVRFIQGHTQPSEKIAVLNIFPILYYLSDREPAINAIAYLPWQKDWEDLRRSRKNACAQLKEARPKLIWLRPWKVWGTYDFSNYASCIDRFIHENYADDGNLWLRRDQKP